LAERFEASDEIEDRPRYKIAPTQPVVAVRREMGKKTRKFTTIRWGFIPSWAKDMSIGTQTLNARSETVTTKPAFRDPILRKQLPYSIGWILRVAEDGISEAALLF
jgi:putative SOS response-associated peptidase YedK